MSFGSIQAEKMTTESGYSLGAGNASSFKNRLINGKMDINQRVFSGTLSSTGNTYTLDRWMGYNRLVASTFSVSQNAGSVTPPAGFTNYLGVTSVAATSVASGDIFYISQFIEGLNVADLGWGTANAKSITLSFWVRSSLTGSFGGSLQNSGSTRSYPFSYTISSANTWEQKTVTIAGDTTGTWLTTNGVGIQLTFSLGTGSSFSGTGGAWTGANNVFMPTGSVQVVSTNGATLYLTGVQFEVGTVATSFDFRDYGTELALCYRYYYKIFPAVSGPMYGVGWAPISTVGAINVAFPVTMRASPSSLETTGVTTDYRVLTQNTSALCTAVPYIDDSCAFASRVGFPVTGLTVGNGIGGRSQSTTSFLAWSAEL